MHVCEDVWIHVRDNHIISINIIIVIIIILIILPDHVSSRNCKEGAVPSNQSRCASLPQPYLYIQRAPARNCISSRPRHRTPPLLRRLVCLRRRRQSVGTLCLPSVPNLAVFRLKIVGGMWRRTLALDVRAPGGSEVGLAAHRLPLGDSTPP